MTDDTLRALERAWRASRSVDDEAAWLAARRRAGDIDDDALGVAAWLGHPASRVVLGLPDDAAADPFVVLSSMLPDPFARARVFATIGILWGQASLKENESSEAMGWTPDREERSRAARRALEPVRRALESARRALEGTGEERVDEVEVPDLYRHLGLDAFYSTYVVRGALRFAREANQPGPPDDMDYAQRALHDDARKALGEGRALAIARSALIQRFLGYRE